MSALEHLHKSLTAGIDHTSLFQHRKHLGGLRKDSFRLLDDFADKHFEILLACHCEIVCPLCRTFCNREDRTLLWLHDSLVRRLHSLVAGGGEDRCVDLIVFLDDFCKSSEKL